MIRFESVTKVFPGAERPAVQDLDLDIPAGATCVLIGPSGCGKTTTMGMVNRLIEPSAGRITVAGENVAEVDPVQLRRRIGYVIQQIGLFPHMTIAQNVATVPRLLQWPKAKIAARVEEMLVLVGLDPKEFGARSPRRLSGGQRQRVGVARALAADPPVMLMDEPFGAVDPVERARLQGEFLALLKRLRKTVIFVTHDMDEAIRMGDRIAIMREGRLAQEDTPDRLLLNPRDPFVADFVGTDRALKRLALTQAGEAVEPGPAPAGSPVVPASANLRDALSLLLASGGDAADIRDGQGASIGRLSLAAIRAKASAASATAGSARSAPIQLGGANREP